MLRQSSTFTRPKGVRGMLAVSIFFVFCALAVAQTTSSTGSIQGMVTDPSGALVKGAKVVVSSNLGISITAMTTDVGVYSSGPLIPGNYTVRIGAAGFKTAQMGLTVQVGVITPGDTTLQAGKPTEVATVKTTFPPVATQQNSVQGVISARELHDLPLNGRSYLDLAQLQPGVQLQDGRVLGPGENGFAAVSIGSRQGRETRFDLDGIEVDNEISGGPTLNLPASGIQEFQVQQSTIQLSTPLTGSGLVNVITKAGSEKFHGEAFGFFRDQSLDANLPGATHTPFQRNQFGGNVGGPITKDKLFFFVDAERTKQDFTEPVLPGGPFAVLAGGFSSPFRDTQAEARVDWQINDRYHFFYRFAYDDNTSVRSTTPSSFQAFSNLNHTPSHTVGLNFARGEYTHSLRFGYLKFSDSLRDASEGAFPAPGIELAIGNDPICRTPSGDLFCSGPSYAAPQQTYQSNGQITYDGSRVWKSHIFYFGANWNHITGGSYAGSLKLAPAVSALFTNCNATCLGLPGGASNPLNYPAQIVQLSNGQPYSTAASAFGLSGGGLGPDNRISAYVGDSWKMHPNFTVNYGVRYVRDSWRTDSDLPALSTLYQFDNLYYTGLGNSVRQPNLNFAPQVGVAWDPSGKGKTVVRAGAGLFYDNSLWNAVEYDRAARLPKGIFASNATVCSGGAAVPLLLPMGGAVTPTFCGQPIGNVVSQISALQAAYQASTAAGGASVNPSYIGNILADGPNVTGTALLAPSFVSPRSLQMNGGIQHEVRPGTILSLDYIRSVETHTLMAVDTNRVGAAPFFNLIAAEKAVSATNGQFGCGTGYDLGSIQCAITNGATISNYAVNGLDSGYALCGGLPCAMLGAPQAAFGGVNPALGANQMLFPIGRAVDTAVQFSLKQHLNNPFPRVKNFNLLLAYQLQRYISTSSDDGLFDVATDFNNPLAYIGPNDLDRKHQISFGSTMDLPWHFHLGMMGHFYSPLPLTLTLPTTGLPGGIFVSDVTGDGTGSGSYASSTYGDVLPGTNVGQFGHRLNPANINKYIDNYNQNFAGRVTPAGQQLLNSSLFTLAQLQTLGAVQQPVQPAPFDEAAMGWLRTFDVNLKWEYNFRDYVRIEPGISFFNAMNLANFDGPANPLSGALQPLGSSSPAGFVNSTSGRQPSGNRIGPGSGVFSQGAPRQLEFSLRISF